jgi:hypothetical protein
MASSVATAFPRSNTPTGRWSDGSYHCGGDWRYGGGREQRQQLECVEGRGLSRADQEPWRKFGQNALANLSDPIKNFQASPDYQFRLSRGLEGVTQNKAVAGLLKSGSALKGLNDYAGASASAEYGDWYNRQMGGAGLGQTANAANQQAGQAYAQTVAQANQANSLAQMQSSYNQANAQNQAIGQVGGIFANVLANYGTAPNYASGGGSSSGYRPASSGRG